MACISEARSGVIIRKEQRDCLDYHTDKERIHQHDNKHRL